MKICGAMLRVCLAAGFSVWTASAGEIFVSPTGTDANPGTQDFPYGTFGKAVSSAAAGDTIFARGGTYQISTPIVISKSGTATSRFFLFAFPGEHPLLDFSMMSVSNSNRGIQLDSSYWYIKGLEISQAGDNGMFIGGSNNVIENCSLHGNHDTGLQIGGGGSFNQIINCDSFNNMDPGQGNADGFSPKLDVGTGNSFFGCRSWYNSDDGWDGYLRPSDDVTTTIENCWCFANGYLSNGAASTGNGNGFKMGGSDTKTLKHNMILKRCLSFDNRVKGFDQNHTRGSITLLNCTAYSNGTNFSVPETLAVSAGKVLTVENCISAGTGGVTLLNAVLATDSWMSPFAPPASGDFVSLDTTGARAPRNPDGSLPDITFMHLASGSQYIDAGSDVGLPFSGSAPDLGVFEFNLPVPIQLAAFTALAQVGSGVRLSWETLSEVNNYGFFVQRRSVADTGWTGLANSFVPGHGTTMATHLYSYLDSAAGVGSWFYRLKQVDLDGSAHYSDQVFVGVLAGINPQASPARWELLQNYPNPFNPTTVISYQLTVVSRVTLTVYDILGREIATLVHEIQAAGPHTVMFDARGLASGMYVYRLEAGGKSQQREMVLVR